MCITCPQICETGDEEVSEYYESWVRDIVINHYIIMVNMPQLELAMVTTKARAIPTEFNPGRTGAMMGFPFSIVDKCSKSYLTQAQSRSKKLVI